MAHNGEVIVRTKEYTEVPGIKSQEENSDQEGFKRKIKTGVTLFSFITF